MSFITENWQMIIVALLAISEVLAMIPNIKSNSIFQLVVNVLKTFAPKKQDEKLVDKK